MSVLIFNACAESVEKSKKTSVTAIEDAKRNKKSATTTTFCVEVRPSGQMVCDPRYAAAQQYGSPAYSPAAPAYPSAAPSYAPAYAPASPAYAPAAPAYAPQKEYQPSNYGGKTQTYNKLAFLH